MTATFKTLIEESKKVTVDVFGGKEEEVFCCKCGEFMDVYKVPVPAITYCDDCLRELACEEEHG